MLIESRVYRCHCKMHVSTSSFIQCKRSLASPWWRLWALTVAAESLLPKAEQHALTHAAVGWLVKMLHCPYVLPILFRHLLGIRENNSSWSDLLVKSRQFNKERKDCIKCWFFFTFSPSRTSKGALFMPPFSHSSRVTVPLSSTSIAVIMSLSTCSITKHQKFIRIFCHTLSLCFQVPHFMLVNKKVQKPCRIWRRNKQKKRLILVWVQSRPSPDNQRHASFEWLYDPLPERETKEFWWDWV